MTTTTAIGRYLGIDAERLTAPMAEAILAFTSTEEVRQRVTELADKANFGTITPEEREEYQCYIEVDGMLTIAKSRAQKFLARQA